MNSTSIIKQPGYTYTNALDFLNEHERTISSFLMVCLALSLCALIVLKFENYRLYQSVSAAQSFNQELKLNQKGLAIDFTKQVSYLSLHDHSKNQWQQVAQA